MAEHPWDEVKEKFNAALSLSLTERELYLKQLSTESTQLHHEVADLLAQHAGANENDFLASLKIGKQTEADLAETIAHFLPTVDTKATGGDAQSLMTLHTQAEIPATSYIGEIGDYQLIEQIGRGGMGVVYKAYQKNVGRTVALKVIAGGSLSSAEDIARFRDEASAAGRLNHPGIVQVYDAGEHEGNHYFSMAYIEGENLASYVGPGKPRLKPKEAARLIEAVCRAVQYAHDHFVIHRDIKPANIMLDKSGQPLLADFGLAKLVGNEGYTQTGQTMGTPNYMAPEQAKGQLELISNRTDVYSLGGTLYALLKGRPPIEGKNLLDTLKKVESAAPETLYFRGSQIPLDLWIICEKCLAKKPDDRYQSAAALAEDLQCFLKGFPISARAVSPWTRLMRWSQRNPLIATLIGTIAATLLIATVVSISFAVKSRADQRLAESNLAMIEKVLDEVLISVSEGDLANDPGTQKVRQRLLRIAQNYFEELSNSHQVSPLRVADAAYLLGRVQSSLGRDDDAHTSLKKALNIQINMLKDAEDQIGALTQIAKTHKEFSRIAEKSWSNRGVFESSDAAKQALADYLKHEKACVQYRELALALGPTNEELHRLLANSQMGLGLGHIQQGIWTPTSDGFSQAESFLLQSQATWDELLAKTPNDPTRLKDSARGHAAKAKLRESQAAAFVESNPEKYEELLTESLKLRTIAAKTLEELPTDAVTPEIRLLQANCFQVCAESQVQLQQIDDAIANYEQALAVFRSLLMSSPLVDSYRLGVAQDQFMLSQLLLSKQDHYGYQFVTDFQHTLVDGLTINPRDAVSADLLLDYTKSISVSLVEQGLFQEALNQLEQAKNMLADIPVIKSDKPLIDAVIEKLEVEATKLREQINTEDRTT